MTGLSEDEINAIVGSLPMYISEQGYEIVRVDGRNTPKHRYMMELYVGRELDFNEVVHHKDFIKTNNWIDNFKIMERGEHTRLHDKRCSECGHFLDSNNKCHNPGCHERIKKGLFGGTYFRCGDCRRYLPKDAFGFDNSKKNKIRNNCNECRRARAKILRKREFKLEDRECKNCHKLFTPNVHNQLFCCKIPCKEDYENAEENRKRREERLIEVRI